MKCDNELADRCEIWLAHPSQCIWTKNSHCGKLCKRKQLLRHMLLQVMGTSTPWEHPPFLELELYEGGTLRRMTPGPPPLRCPGWSRINGKSLDPWVVTRSLSLFAIPLLFSIFSISLPHIYCWIKSLLSALPHGLICTFIQANAYLIIRS